MIPEMLQAGVEMLAECRERDLSDVETCLQVWEAMEAVRAIAEIRKRGPVH